MGLKITVHSHCEDCGVRVAKVRQGFICVNRSACTCPKPPGPSDPPRRLSFSEATFIENGPPEDPWEVRRDDLRGKITRMRAAAEHLQREAERIGDAGFKSLGDELQDYVDRCHHALMAGVDFERENA